MLGQPLSMLIPQVVGFRLHGKLREGSTATDLVLTVTEILRKEGVVGKFVEFFGAGWRPDARRSRDHRQHGARVRRDVRHLPDRRRDAALPAPHGPRPPSIELVEAYAQEQGFFHGPRRRETEYSSVGDLDLGDAWSRAWPVRSGRRIACSLFKTRKSFEDALPSLARPRPRRRGGGGPALDGGHQRRLAPASKPSPDVKNGSVVIAAIAAAPTPRTRRC